MSKRSHEAEQTQSTAMVPWMERLAAAAKEVARVERPAVTRMSLKSGMMTVLGQPVPGNNVDVVILASVMEQALYTKPYNPMQVAAPDCFSFSLDGENPRPHDQSLAKQHENCTDCPHNQWGSGMRNGVPTNGKACKEYRRLGMITAEDLKGDIARAEFCWVAVPPTSVKNWANYVQELLATQQRPPWGVITNIKLRPHVKNQMEVVFTFKAPIAEDYLDPIAARLNQSVEILTVPYTRDEKGALSEQTKQQMSGAKY